LQRDRIDERFYHKKVQSVENDEQISDRIYNLKRNKDRERRKKAFIAKLKKEERDQSALHIERQRKLRSERAMQRVVSGQQKIASRDWDRQRRWERQQVDLIAMNNMKYRMEEKFDTEVGTNKGSLQTLRGIAMEYGVDIDELQRRKTRRVATGPPSAGRGKASR
jgi:hypothetical protein